MQAATASSYTTCEPARQAQRAMIHTPAARTEPPFVAFVGFDWGDQQHALLLGPVAAPPEASTLPHSAENLHQWCLALEERFGGRPVALAVEAGHPGVLAVLSQYPWLFLYPIHPATSGRFRQAFVPSGAKDDQPDAQVLHQLVRHHRDRLRPFSLDDPDTRQLAALCRLRRQLVDQRTALSNQLTGLLKSYYPQALELAGQNLVAPLALDFLVRWPDLLALKAARPATLRSFYHRHNVRSPQLVAQRLERVAQARALTTDPAITLPAVRGLQALVAQLRVLQQHIQGLEKDITRAFRQHPERALFADLPGAGPNLGPRLLVAFGTQRDRLESAAALQKQSGVAPITERSGARAWIHRRWNAPGFLHQSLVEWARCSIPRSAWAAAFYQSQKKRGKSEHAVLRALAFKWIRILWKCWQTRTPYNEARYLKSLASRGSPLAKLIASPKPVAVS